MHTKQESPKIRDITIDHIDHQHHDFSDREKNTDTLNI